MSSTKEKQLSTQGKASLKESNSSLYAEYRAIERDNHVIGCKFKTIEDKSILKVEVSLLSDNIEETQNYFLDGDNRTRTVHIKYGTATLLGELSLRNEEGFITFTGNASYQNICELRVDGIVAVF